MLPRLIRPALLAAAVCASSALSLAAPPETTAPRAWDFWEHNTMRRAQIRSELAALPASTTRTVVLLGDSITEGHPIRRVGGYRVINQGISGDVTDSGTSVSGLASRLDWVRQARPAHVFLMIGINDLGSSIPVPRLEKNYVALVNRLRHLVPDATIHLQSILPTSRVCAHLNAGVVEMNRRICRYARARGLDYVDLHTLMKNEKGELRDDYTDLGLHLVRPAYDVWGRVLEQRLSGQK